MLRVLIFLALAGPAWAQPVVEVVQPSPFDQFWISVQGPLWSFLAVVAMAAIGLATNYLRKLVGDNAATKLNDIAQSAIKNAAGLALNELGNRVVTEAISPNDPAVQAGVQRVRSVISDTIEKIEVAQGGKKITDSALAGAIIGKLNEMMAPAMLAAPKEEKK